MNVQPEIYIKTHIAEKIISVFSDISVDDIIGDFSIPPDIKLGEYAFACFGVTKILRKPPHEIAHEIADSVSPDDIIKSVTAAGPYVNITLHASSFAQLVLCNDLYHPKKQDGEKIMLEYSGPNPCKTFHVGHFRNTILGSAMINLYRYAGYQVTPVNYLNDTGTHVAKVIWIYLRSYQGQEPDSQQGRWLGELYVEANAILQDQPDLMEEVYAIHRKLESNDSEVATLLEQFKRWSKEEFDSIYQQLDAEFEIDFYDSIYIVDGKSVVQELLDKKIAQISEGATIVDLEDHGLHVALILKSDGSAVYITKDLAMAQDRFQKYDVDRLVYVVGAEQILHFKQIFKILELNGFEQAKNCFHLAYELVNTASGKKMSTREGTVVLYHQMYEQAYEMALSETRQRHEEWSEEQILDTAEKIALCALKFDMLKQDAQKKINFDIQTALDVSGDTGPYVMYTMARLRSIIDKGTGEVSKENFAGEILDSPEERKLLQKMSQFNGVVLNSAQINKPSLIAHYLLELSRLVNQYYHSTQIIQDDAKTQMMRIELLKKVVLTLEYGFKILNIRWVNEM